MITQHHPAGADALPGFDDVLGAAERLRGIVRPTPLLESRLLNQQVGGRILLKAEALQHTGSFKFRGAYNAISQTTADAVIAFSSGNHAQGVAAAAAMLGKKATIVMPADAPAIKQANTRSYGADLRLYDRLAEDRERIAEEIMLATGAALIRPFDDARVMAGQGTLALELAEQARDADASPDAVLMPCSGGGLAAGCALALKSRLPKAELYTVEPEGHDDMRRSLLARRIVANGGGRRSICDALLAPQPGQLTFPINMTHLTGGLVVSDDDVRHAMIEAFVHFKLVLEPGGAIALAAILAGKLDSRNRTIVAVVSGGNVDPAAFAAILGGHASGQSGK